MRVRMIGELKKIGGRMLELKKGYPMEASSQFL